MIYLKVLKLKNRLLFSVAISCGFFVVKGARAQDISNTIEAPSADGISSDPMASFSGSATGENETASPATGGINAPSQDGGNPETQADHNHIENVKAETSDAFSENVSSGANDLTQTPSYQHYFGPNAALPPRAPTLDPDDPRNGPTYKKYFIPVEDRSPRMRKSRRRSFGGPRAGGREHFGVSGHRRSHPVDIEESHNAETVIGRQTLEHFVAGTNALQALAASTPGANFSSSDAQGMDPTANTFYLRGYDQTQLGVTMDGIPMGDQGFGGSSGADVSQIMIQDNMGAIAASQGAGALDTPSSTTLGGTITYTSLDPSDHFGVKINQQFASFNGYRTFGRLDSGKLNRTGTKFTASFLRNSQDLWTNSIIQPWGTQSRGFQREEVVNFKLVQPVSTFGKITLTSNWADVPQYNQAQINPGMKKNLPYGISNFYPNYGMANNCADGGPSCNLGPGLTPDQKENYAGNLAYQGSQVQRIYLEGLRGDFQISPSIKSSSVIYGQVADNRMGGTDAGWPSPGPKGNPNMNFMDEHLKGRRLGVTQNFAFQLGHRNSLKTGVWYENNRYHMPTYFYGYGVDSPIQNDFGLQNKNGSEAYGQTFTTNTFQFFIEDGFQMAKNMNFTYGFKSLVQSTNGGTDFRASNDALANWLPEDYKGANIWRPVHGRITQSNAFLPHFNYDWKFMPKHEFYFDVAENMRPIDPGGTAWSQKLGSGASMNSAQQVFDQQEKKLRGERTWNYVVGYRYAAKPFNFAVDYYHTDYINRLGAISQPAQGNQIGGQRFVNLGPEKMDGVDIGGTLHLSHILRLPDSLGKLDFANSFSYNHAVYEPTVASLAVIKGQQQVLYPRYMYKTNVHYGNGRLGWDLNVNYNSKQNMTYSGDVKNPGYWTSTFTGYLMLGPHGKESNAKMTFGVTNLFGQHYTVASYSSVPLAAPKGDNGKPDLDAMSATQMWAAPREFFGAVEFGF